MEVINDTTGIQWILRDYYVWLYNNLLENLEEIPQFLAQPSKTEAQRNRKSE